MRILEFEVKNQRLMKQKQCDFSGLVAGSEGYLKAKFVFSNDGWISCPTKIARFWLDGKEHAVRLDADGSCTIPSEVLTGKKFSVSVLGAASGYRVETNKLHIRQEAH